MLQVAELVDAWWSQVIYYQQEREEVDDEHYSRHVLLTDILRVGSNPTL